MMGYEALIAGACPHCSNGASKIYHYGGPCPNVKAIEYYPDGSVRRIELREQVPARDPSIPATRE